MVYGPRTVGDVFLASLESVPDGSDDISCLFIMDALIF